MGGGTTRWMSPELLHPEQFDFGRGMPTEESDCYALGMVIYEVLSGRIPFASSRDTAVIWKVLNGGRPERPHGEESVWFTDNLWEMLELCWASRPEIRPSIDDVFECLERVPWPPLSADVESSSTTSNSCTFYRSIQNLHLMSNPPRLVGQPITQGGNHSLVPSHNYPSNAAGPPKSREGEG